MSELYEKATARPWVLRFYRHAPGQLEGIQAAPAPGEKFGGMITVARGLSRQQGQGRNNAALIVHAVNNIERLEQQNAKLREALERLAEGDEPRPVGKNWFPDERASKHDQCKHEVWMYESCGSCIAEFACAALEGIEP